MEYKIQPGTVEKIQKVKKLVSEGVTVKDACKRAGISQSWIYIFRRRHPRLTQELSL